MLPHHISPNILPSRRLYQLFCHAPPCIGCGFPVPLHGLSLHVVVGGMCWRIHRIRFDDIQDITFERQQCQVILQVDRLIVVVVVSAANDTLIFLAITCKLLLDGFFIASRPSTKWFVIGLFRGEGLGKVSQLLLQTRQLYYLLVTHYAPL